MTKPMKNTFHHVAFLLLVSIAMLVLGSAPSSTFADESTVLDAPVLGGTTGENPDMASMEYSPLLLTFGGIVAVWFGMLVFKRVAEAMVPQAVPWGKTILALGLVVMGSAGVVGGTAVAARLLGVDLLSDPFASPHTTRGVVLLTAAVAELLLVSAVIQSVLGNGLNILEIVLGVVCVPLALLNEVVDFIATTVSALMLAFISGWVASFLFPDTPIPISVVALVIVTAYALRMESGGGGSSAAPTYNTTPNSGQTNCPPPSCGPASDSAEQQRQYQEQQRRAEEERRRQAEQQRQYAMQAAWHQQQQQQWYQQH